MRCVDSRDILSGENLKIALKVCLGDEEGTALLRMCLVVVYGDEKKVDFLSIIANRGC